MSYFGEKVQVVMGDLFQMAPDGYALAHCVGADLRMGKGIAVEFLQRYQGKEYLLQQGKVPGQVAVLSPNMCSRSAPIFYLVSKLRSTDYSPRWEDFCACLRELRRLCEEQDVRHVAMPMIGCGEDHLPWPDVEQQLYSTFQMSSVHVFVFKRSNPQGDKYPPLHLQPTFEGWQLLGDSQLVRFSSNFGTYQQNPRERFPKQLGLCISGQRLRSLLFHLVNNDLSSRVVLMIGTNDVLHLMRNASLKKHVRKTWRANLFHLVKLLAQRCQHVLICTIPPVPAHKECDEHVVWVNNLFKSVCAHQKYNNIHLVDWADKLKLSDGSVDVSLFEAKMGPPGNQRDDLIHLNFRGQSLLKGSLHQSISALGC